MSTDVKGMNNVHGLDVAQLENYLSHGCVVRIISVMGVWRELYRSWVCGENYLSHGCVVRIISVMGVWRELSQSWVCGENYLSHGCVARIISVMGVWRELSQPWVCGECEISLVVIFQNMYLAFPAAL